MYQKTLALIQARLGNRYRIDTPDPIKPTIDRFPVWDVRLGKYLQEWKEKGAREFPESPWLFPDPDGWAPEPGEAVKAGGILPFSPEKLSRLFRKYLMAAGLPIIPLRKS